MLKITFKSLKLLLLNTINILYYCSWN